MESMNLDNYVFFLGGMDAEMAEIKNILEENSLLFYNKNLFWGAKASDYLPEIRNLKENQTPVLIELDIDIPIPDNKIIIDHHNENVYKSSSIEQIADLLNIKLNRWQQLIAVNDIGHIEAMKRFGATDKEINEVRAFDRKCQGVSKEDELNAKLSIENYSEILNKDCILINSLTEKTSPITDLIYGKYKHIIIITPGNEFNYFGPGNIIQKLIEIYTDKQKSNSEIKFWSGGDLPEKGFFGSNHLISIELIKGILE